MTPGQIQGAIDEICEGLDHQRNTMILMQGSDRMVKPFTITFDPDVQTYEEMNRILEAVRARFPQWRIKGEWKR